ncbi:MAG: 30S ribosomal protein S3 [Candidatus Nealsonbacteria bacterium]|nr:30S ribosomal protein S3 [Candidatus Nealsonbacteria bacterium]
MAHKVHPKSYRLKNLADWNSRWFDKKNFPKHLEEDFKIREYLQKKIGKLGIEKIEIERFAGKLNIIISSARPGLIIGRGGSGIEELKKVLEIKVLKNNKAKKEVRIEIREVKDIWSSASLSAQYIAQQIEKRVPFRKVLKQTLEKISMSKQVKGARIEVRGRLNGAEIARREWLQKGRLPRQTIRADIDFIEDRAYCTYGTIGIKVWIYKGDKFD